MHTLPDPPPAPPRPPQPLGSTALRGQVVALSVGEPLLTAQIARALRADGAHVALLGEGESLRRLQGLLAATHTGSPPAPGSGVFWVEMSPDDPRDVEAALDDVLDRYLALDVLVQLVQPGDPATGASIDARAAAERWDAEVSLPLRRAQTVATAALAHMRASGSRGLVMLVHSTEDLRASLGSDALSHALLGLAEGLCREGARGGIEARLLRPAPKDAAAAAPHDARLVVIAPVDEGAEQTQRASAGLAMTARWLCRLLRQRLLRPAVPADTPGAHSAQAFVRPDKPVATRPFHRPAFTAAAFG